MNKAQFDKILTFIQGQRVGVLATSSKEGSPEAASMVISETDQLELIFQTPITARKYANLQHNDRVAVVFGWDLHEFTTVQFEGVAREVTDQKEREWCGKIHVAKNPKSKAYVDLMENKFFVVSPRWARYWDFKTDEQFEVYFLLAGIWRECDRD
jgi:general stress protein 26